MKNKIKISENDLQNNILEWLSFQRGFLFRNNTVGVYDKVNKFYRRLPKYAVKGGADIIGVYKGMAIAIEVKATGIKRLGKDQEIFKMRWEDSGGVYYLANDFEEFIKWFNKL